MADRCSSPRGGGERERREREREREKERENGNLAEFQSKKRSVYYTGEM
jgi:hypothetical protein